jgi:hypothetical protein
MSHISHIFELDNDTTTSWLSKAGYEDIKFYSKTCKCAHSFIDKKFWEKKTLIDMQNEYPNTTHAEYFLKLCFQGAFYPIKEMIDKKFVTIDLVFLKNVIKQKKISIRTIIYIINLINVKSLKLETSIHKWTQTRNIVTFIDCIVTRDRQDVSDMMNYLISKNISLAYGSLLFYFSFFTQNIREKILSELSTNTVPEFTESLIIKETNPIIRLKIAELYIHKPNLASVLIRLLFRLGNYDSITYLCDTLSYDKILEVTFNMFEHSYCTSARFNINSKFLSCVCGSSKFKPLAGKFLFMYHTAHNKITDILPVLMEYIDIDDIFYQVAVKSDLDSQQVILLKELLQYEQPKNIELKEIIDMLLEYDNIK